MNYEDLKKENEYLKQKYQFSFDYKEFNFFYNSILDSIIKLKLKDSDNKKEYCNNIVKEIDEYIKFYQDNINKINLLKKELEFINSD
jgi:hypothetical protein